jgi:hypothetical protein
MPACLAEVDCSERLLIMLKITFARKAYWSVFAILKRYRREFSVQHVARQRRDSCHGSGLGVHDTLSRSAHETAFE